MEISPATGFSTAKSANPTSDQTLRLRRDHRTMQPCCDASHSSLTVTICSNTPAQKDHPRVVSRNSATAAPISAPTNSSVRRSFSGTTAHGAIYAFSRRPLSRAYRPFMGTVLKVANGSKPVQPDCFGSRGRWRLLYSDASLGAPVKRTRQGLGTGCIKRDHRVAPVA